MDSKTAYNQLVQARGSARSATDLYKEQQGELGVDASRQRTQDLRGLIRNTEQSLRGVEASVTGRTQGSLVTEAQRSRLANLERAPIAEELQTLSGSLSDENAMYTSLLDEAGKRAGLTYQSQQDRLSALESNYSLAVAAEQEAEKRRQFELSLQLEREKAEAAKRAATKPTYDIQALINQILGKNKPAPKPQSAIPKFTVDKSRGMNMDVLKSGAFR